MLPLYHQRCSLALQARGFRGVRWGPCMEKERRGRSLWCLRGHPLVDWPSDMSIDFD
jgi:hypothetical protein